MKRGGTALLFFCLHFLKYVQISNKIRLMPKQLRKTATDDLNQRLASKVWRGSNQLSQLKSSTIDNRISTGYEELDAKINGWPLGSTTEIALGKNGMGELRLLIPALKSLQQRQHGPNRIFWISPPLQPNALALQQAGVDLSQLTIINGCNNDEAMWACEQVLKSGSCAAAISWATTSNISNTVIRRLNLASEQHNCWQVLFRPYQASEQASPSGLKIRLESNQIDCLKLSIIKQANSWNTGQVSIQLSNDNGRFNTSDTRNLPVPSWQQSEVDGENSSLEREVKQHIAKPATRLKLISTRKRCTVLALGVVATNLRVVYAIPGCIPLEMN